MSEKDFITQHLKDVQHIVATTQPEKSYELNLADDQQYRYLRNLHKMNGMTPDRYPQTFSVLESQRQADLGTKRPDATPTLSRTEIESGTTGFGTLAKITAVGSAKNGTEACATAFLAVDGGASTATISLYVYDNTDPLKPKVIAHNTVTLGTKNFIPIQAVGGTPVENMYAMMTYSYTPMGGSPVPPQTKTANSKNGQVDPTVKEPVQKTSHLANKNIRIALSRGDYNRKNADVDYWFNKDLVYDTTIIVPFVGSATFANPVNLDSLQLNLVVALQDGGASVTPTKPTNLSSHFSLSTDSKTLSWNFPANAIDPVTHKPDPGTMGTPVVYQTAPWKSDAVSYFFASVGINEVGSNETQWVHMQSTEIADEVDNDGIEYIKPLVFLWHCLAKGTMIALADGSSIPIEDVTNENSVIVDNQGNTMPVLATTLGDSLHNEMYNLTTDGKKLILSAKHLVVTSDGVKQAEELKLGDSILTEDGPTAITSIEKDAFAGKLYNLELGTDGDVPEEGSTFFANGICVGDYQKQSHYHRAAQNDPEKVLAQLPKEWHTDYMSHLEDEDLKKKVETNTMVLGSAPPELTKPVITAVVTDPIEHVPNNFNINLLFDKDVEFDFSKWMVFYFDSASSNTPSQFPVTSATSTSFTITATPGTGAYLLIKGPHALQTNAYYVLGETPKTAVSLLDTQLEIDLTLNSTNNFSGGKFTLYEKKTIIGNSSFEGQKGKLVLEAPLSGDNYTVKIEGTANSGVSISQSITVPVITTSYSTKGVSYDNKVLNITTSKAPAGGESVYANLYANGVQTKSLKLSFTGSVGSIDLTSSLYPWANNTVATQVIASNSYGPQSAPWEVLNTTPLLLNAYCSTEHIYVKWVLPPISSIVHKVIAQISAGGPKIDTKNIWITENHVLIGLKEPLTATPAAFTIQMNAAQGKSTGPSSNTITVESPSPTVLSAEYDGTNVNVAWEEINQVVSGYTIQLMVGGSTLNTSSIVPAGTSSFQFAPQKAIKPTDVLTIVMEANFIDNIGPGLPSAPKDVSFVPAFFFGPTQPSIYAISSHKDLPIPSTGEAIKLYLPNGNYGVSTGDFVVPTAGGTYFTIAVNTDRFELTIAAKTWAIPTNEIRADIQTAYKAFLEGIEAKNSTFSAWGISVIQEAIARNMPQSFAENLFYSYGLDLTSGSGLFPHADLRTGMILRVLPANYAVVPGSDREGEPYSYLNGYTNSSPIDYDISSYTEGGNYKLGFDAFITDLVSSGALTVDSPLIQNTPNVSGISSAADLYSPGFKNAFYRLFIPTKLLNSTSAGATQPQFQFNLVSASNFTDLEGTTNPTSANKNTYFRGRSVLKLCIRVMVNGNDSIVPIGTTVAQILERYGQLTSKSEISLKGLTLERSIGQSRTSKSTDVSMTSNKVRFDYGTFADYPSFGSSLDLPLLHGDSLTF
jgi:hypothetical protein